MDAKWQPIETAPKDPDDRIVLWDGYNVFIGFWSNIRASVVRGGDGWLTDGLQGLMIAPTHWMPLPPPPAQEQEGA